MKTVTTRLMWSRMKRLTKVPVNGPARARWISANRCRWLPKSVFARYISSLKEQRVAASKVPLARKRSQLATKVSSSRKFVVRCISGKIVSYAQGLLSAACGVWRVQLGSELRRTSRRFSVLAASSVRSSCRKSPMLMPKIRRSLTCCWLRTSSKLPMTASRRCAMSLLCSAVNGIPVPTFAAAVCLQYDSYRAAVLPANLIQLSAWLFRCAYL